MKILNLFLASVLAVPAIGQTVYTVPQGYTKVTVPGAAAAGAPSLTAISANLLQETAFAGNGLIAADYDADPDSNPETPLTNQSIQVSGATWAPDAWIASPHLVFIKNASDAEEAFLIVGNTADTLTIDSRFDLLAASRFPATATSVKIRRANTLGSILGTDQTPFTSNDLVFLWDGTNWESHVAFGGSWFVASGSNAGANSTDQVVFPEEGLFIQRSELTPATITCFGEIPVGMQASTVPGSASTFVSTRFPVGNTPEAAPVGVPLPQLSLNTIPGWSSSDTVFVWTGSVWQGFVEFGGDWFFSTGPNAGGDANGYVVNANTAVFVTRSSAGTAAASPLAVPPPYSVQTAE